MLYEKQEKPLGQEGKDAMSEPRPRRSLRNMYLTKKFHFLYMGLWIGICVCMLLIIDALVFLYLREHWISLQLRAGLTVDHPPVLTLVYILAISAETAFLAAGIVFLAKSTAHRVAGPYIRLQRVFDAIREGNMEQTLKFRSYDRLEDVEKSFNSMMESIRQKLPKS